MHRNVRHPRMASDLGSRRSYCRVSGNAGFCGTCIPSNLLYESLVLSTVIQGYSGGPLPSTVGDRLVEAGVHLVPVYGGTEFGPPSSFLKGPMNKEDWEYIFFSQFVKTRWIDQGDGTYELQFLVRLVSLIAKLYADAWTVMRHASARCRKPSRCERLCDI